MKVVAYIILLFTISTSVIKAQSTLASAVTSKYLTNYGDEKVHLHLDKPYYAAGDIIWLKAYVTDYATNKPSAISGVLYIDFINEKNAIAKQLKLQVKGGTAWGNIELADTLSEGNYRISAYTQWMRNFGKDYFFNQHIKIGNSLTSNIFTKTTFSTSSEKNNTQVKSSITLSKRDGKPHANTKVTYQVVLDDKIKSSGSGVTDANGVLKISFNPLTKADETLPQYIIISITQPTGLHGTKTIPIVIKSKKPDVQFLPEGGQLFDGLPCKIGIKSLNEKGLGENITGVILDNTGTEVTTFETFYLGMGHCVLTPDISKTYSAKVKLADGNFATYPLPSISKSGHQLSINTIDSSKLDIKILTTESLLKSEPLRLVSRRGTKLLLDMAISTEQQITALTLPRNAFPSGILQFTLLNSKEQPISERMVFMSNVSNGNITLGVDHLKNNYNKRELVEFEINAQSNGSPVLGSFSIAVTNAEVVTPDIDNETNIFSSLLLKSELTGHIEKPNAYFVDNSEQTHNRLDNLMLTQAWRKFNWNTQDTSYNIKYLPEKNLQITGTVTTLNKKSIANASTILMFPNNKMLVANTETNENGEFDFQDIYLEDDNKFIIQASTKEGKKHVAVKLNKVDEQPVKNVSRADIETDVNLSLANYLEASQSYFEELYKTGSLNKTVMLKTVNIVEKKNIQEEKAAPHSSNRNGRGRADQVISENELKNVHSLELFIARGSIRGLTIERPTDGSPPYAALTRTPYGPVSYEIDGMIINEMNIADISIDEIESIEVLINQAFLTMYGTTIQGGLLVISTKRGKGRSLSDIHAPGLVASNIKGYSPPKMFYAPKYDIDKEEQPDLRTTVYWNPNITSTDKGKAKVSFYNGDKVGKHRIVIEGIDADGNLARSVLNYEVKNTK